MGVVGVKPSDLVADARVWPWLLAPLWIGVGASLPPSVGDRFAAVVAGIGGAVGWSGEATLHSVGALPADWPLVAVVSGLSPLLVGVVVLPLFVWAVGAVTAALVRARSGSGVLG